MLSRTDVLKKTVLRALRKDYAESFAKYLKTQDTPSPESSEEFYKHLQSYTLTLPNKEELPNLAFSIGMFIDYCKMK